MRDCNPMYIFVNFFTESKKAMTEGNKKWREEVKDNAAARKPYEDRAKEIKYKNEEFLKTPSGTEYMITSLVNRQMAIVSTLYVCKLKHK